MVSKKEEDKQRIIEKNICYSLPRNENLTIFVNDSIFDGVRKLCLERDPEGNNFYLISGKPKDGKIFRDTKINAKHIKKVTYNIEDKK